MGLSKLLKSASARPTWLECQNAWLHFRSVLTAKDLKFRFHPSALPWLPKSWCSASAFPLCLDCQRSEVPRPHFRSALTAKKCEGFASALPLCLYCQLCEVLLPRFRSALTGKDLKFRFPHLFCQDFQRCEVPFPHFIPAWTSKDLQFRFCSFALSWLPKIWRSASPLTLCLHCQIWEVPPQHFPSALTANDL